MLLFCVIVTLLSVNNAVGTDYEFFQSEEGTFTCEHNKTLSELSEVKWKIGTKICAKMDIFQGDITSRWYNCAFEPRTANFTSTSLTLSEMKSFDDGEFSCTATLSDYTTTIDVTHFNVTVKVRPNNLRLQVNDESYTCTEEITMENTPNYLMLNCSVESKPQATFTWSTNQALSGSLQNTTQCVKNSTSLVYTCTNILTLPSVIVEQNGKIVVTCLAEAVNDTKEACVTLVPLTTTQTIPTTAESTSTVGITSTVGTTSTVGITTTVGITSTTKATITTEATSTMTSSITSAASGIPLPTTKASTTTLVTPTSPEASKWKTIYILPILIGAAVVAGLIIYALMRCYSARHSQSHAPENPAVEGAPAEYTYIAEVPPAKTPKKQQQLHDNNHNRKQGNKGQGRKNNRGGGRSDAANWNSNDNRHGQMNNSRGISRRSEPNPSGQAYRNARTGQQFQHSSANYPGSRSYPASSNYPASSGYQASSGYPVSSDYPASSGYPVSTGYPAWYGYPASSGYPAVSHVQKAMLPHVARAYNRGHTARK